MLRRLSAIAVLTLVGSCFFNPVAHATTIAGKLEVSPNGSLRIQREDGLKVHFYAGSYPAKISIRGGRTFVSITRKDIVTDATLVHSENTKIPDNGRLTIDGTKTGQTFSIDGPISTQVDRSPTRSDLESCSYYRREWVCYGHRPHGNCRWENVLVPGYQDVEYYFITRTIGLDVTLKSNNGGRGQFKGQSTNREKVYTYIGQCY